MALYTCAGCEDLWNAPQAPPPPGPVTVGPSDTQVIVGASGQNIVQVTQKIPWLWIVLGALVGYSMKSRRKEASSV